MRKKPEKIFSIFIILLSLLSGCSENNIPVSTDKPKEEGIKNDYASVKDDNKIEKKNNGHLKILCNNNIVIAVNELIDFYCSENNIKKDNFEIRILNEDTVGKEENFDMIFNDTDSIYYITDDSNSDVMISDEIGLNEKDLSGLYSGILDAGKNSDNEIKAVPVIIEPVVFCYRDDIAADFFDYNEKDMSEATENWNSFRYTAKDVYDKTDNDIKICTLNEIKEYYTDMSHSSFLNNDSLTVSDKLIEGYEYIREFINEGYAADYELYSDEWKEALMDDEIFGFFADFYDERADILNDIMNDEYIRWNQSWKCTEGPDSMIKNGVWVSVGSEAVNVSGAENFIEFYTTNEDSVKKYALQNKRYMSNSNVMKSIIKNEEYDGVKWIRSQNEHLILDDAASKFKAENNKTGLDEYLLKNYRESLDLFFEGEYSLTEDAVDGFKMMSEKILNEKGFSVELMTE